MNEKLIERVENGIAQGAYTKISVDMLDKWYKLLKSEGINSKAIVRDVIRKVLENAKYFVKEEIVDEE